MNDFRQMLDQQLGKLEAEQELIDQAITEIRRRQGILEEIAGWNLVDEETEPAQPQESENHSGSPEWGNVNHRKKLGEPETIPRAGSEPSPALRKGPRSFSWFTWSNRPFSVLVAASAHQYLADLLFWNFPPGPPVGKKR